MSDIDTDAVHLQDLNREEIVVILDDLRNVTAWLEANSEKLPSVAILDPFERVLSVKPYNVPTAIETVLWLTTNDGVVDWELCDTLYDAAKDGPQGHVGNAGFYVRRFGDVAHVVRTFGYQEIVVVLDWEAMGA